MSRRRLHLTMAPKKKTEKKYVPKDYNDFDINRKTLVSLGFVSDGSLWGKIRATLFITFICGGPVHHLLPLVIGGGMSTDQLFISLSIFTLCFLLAGSWFSMIGKSSDIVKIWNSIRQGFYSYTEPLTEEERIIVSKINDSVVRSTRISLIAYFTAGFGTFVKELKPEGFRKFNVPYPGWFPWKTDNFFKYLASLIFQLSLAMNATCGLESIFLLFTMFSLHLEGQFSLLKKHYLDTFPQGIPRSTIYSDEFKGRTVRRLKECVQHHLVLKAFHQTILKYFGVSLLIYRTMCTTMLCFLCYLSTTELEWTNLVQITSLSATLLFLLFIFCIKGEQISKTSEQWKDTIYEVNWWDYPLEVQKMILTMLVGATPMTIYGVWRPVVYTHRGISDIGQETFSFFNVLRAAK